MSKVAKTTRRVVAISDLHSGHAVGLTPPEYDGKYGEKAAGRHYEEARSIYWRFFAEEIDSLKPVDVLIVNADCIDGKGDKSGGTEQLTTDRTIQVKMAADAIRYVEAAEIYMTYGTGYHTGNEEDWEDRIAADVGAKRIGSHIWVNVNDLIFDVKHHVGGSQSPVGRLTPLAREKVWNLMWNEYGEYPKADVIIRSHVHYHTYGGGYRWLGMTLPALQGYGSKFGARRMVGTVDFGFVHFDVESKGNFAWQSHIMKSSELRPVVYRAK